MGQRHDRVQTKSQELQSWTAVSTLLGLVSRMFPRPTRSQRLYRRLQNLYVPAGKGSNRSTTNGPSVRSAVSSYQVLHHCFLVFLFLADQMFYMILRKPAAF